MADSPQSLLPPDAETPSLERPSGEAAAAEDALASTLTHQPGTPSSVKGVALPEPSWSAPPAERARYLLQGVVAQGGHGRIVRAQDLHLERMVALKEPFFRGGSLEERFVREARITARLQHPSIVPVYEAGRWPSGEPFYAMKLVSGRSLAQAIASMSSVGQRLAALPHVLAVAEAMAYAHSQRIIHRDLKPSNVLVGEFGETVVIDWGLAKELDRPEALPVLGAPGASSSAHTPVPERTQLGTVMGTPAYMPPEQAAGQSVDEHADVYALGAILYQLLSGQPPYSGSTAQEVLQRVLQEEPAPLTRLQPGLPQDLLDIVSRAMAREPTRRYPSARELAEDLRRFQTGQLVGSHRYTVRELLGRFARKHRVAFAVAAVLLALLAATAVTYQLRILEERRIAQQERDRAQQERDLAEQQKAAAQEAQREAARRADLLTLEKVRDMLPKSPEGIFAELASLSPSFAEWQQARTLAAAALAQGVPVSLRGHEDAINHISFSPDGRQVASASDDRTVRVWEVPTGSSRVLEPLGDEVWRTIFSPDGRYLAAACKDGEVRLWELPTNTFRSLKGHGQSVITVLFSPDGRHLYSIDLAGQLRQWDVTSDTGRVLGTHEGGRAELVLLADGKHLLTAGTQDNSVRLWNLENGSSQLLYRDPHPLSAVTAASHSSAFAVGTSQGKWLLWETPQGRPRTADTGLGVIQSLRLSPDGRYLAAHSVAGPLQLWDLTNRTSQFLPSDPGWRSALAFSPDGRWVAAGSLDGKTQLGEVSSGRLRRLHGAVDTVSAVAFSPDGKWVATGSHDHALRLHSVEDLSSRVVVRHARQDPAGSVSLTMRHLRLTEIMEALGRSVVALSLSPDGHRVLSAGTSDVMVRTSKLSGAPGTAVRAHSKGITAAFALPSGSRLVTAGEDSSVALWDNTGQQLQSQVVPTQRIHALSLSSDEAWVAVGDSAGAVWVGEVATGQGHVLGKHLGRVHALAFSPDGRRLASVGADGALKLWDIVQGSERTVHKHGEDAVSVVFSPDGRYLASGSADHSVWLHALDSDQGQRVEVGSLGVLMVLFSPDSRTLLSTSWIDSSVSRWDVATGRFLAPLRGHAGFVTHMAFSPEGLRLVTASADGTARIWDLQSGESRVLRGHEGPVVQVAFTWDGKSVLSAGLDGSVRQWADDLPLEPQELREWIRQNAAR